MRQRKNNIKKERKSAHWERLRQIWSAATASDWLTLLQRIAPAHKWSRNGQTVTGLCPYHEEKTPSLKLNFSMRLGKCFGCGKTITDIVQLVAKLQGSSYLAALLYLNNELNLSNILGDDSDKFSEYHELEEMKNAAAVAFGQVVEEFVRDHPKHLDYMRQAAVYLEKARKVPLSMVPSLPVAIFPKPEHARKYIDQEYHALYDKYFREVNNAKFWGSIIFWYNDSPGTISNFKLRLPAREATAVLASVDKVEDLDAAVARSLFSKIFHVVKDPVERPLGVFGLHHYSRLISDHNTSAVITEGEFDALSIMVEQLKNGSTLDFPIFAGGGGAGTEFSFLRECWIRTLYVVTDAPGSKRGVEVAYNWLCSRGNHVGDPANQSIRYRIFMWPPEVANVAEDLDEAVQVLGYEAVYSFVWKDAENNYLGQLPWATEQCDAALAAIDAEFKVLEDEAIQNKSKNALANLDADKRARIVDTISMWMKAIHDKGERAIFVSSFTSKAGVDITLDDSMFNAVHDVNTMEGAVEVVREAFFNLVSIPYTETKQGTTLYCVYSRTQETHCLLSMGSDHALQAAVTQYVGNDMVLWMKSLLRNAVTVTVPEEEREKYVTNPNALRQEEIRRAITVMRQVIFTHVGASCVNKNSLIPIAQGIHFKDVPGNKHVYVVNGAKIFKGTYDPPSGADIEWEQIRDIRDGNYYFFSNNKERWSETVNEIHDLYYGVDVDLHKEYNEILKYVDCWLFENHDVMRRFIAAWIMSLPIQLATKRVTVTFITGESTSGKTSFAQGLLGGIWGSGHEIPSILEPAKVTTNASEAYVYQSMNLSSLLMNIDEAETDDTTEHNMRMREILKLLYGVSTGGSKIGRGSAAGSDVIEYTLQCPILCAGIHLPVDETFLTRVVVLYTKKDYTRRNIADVIAELFTEQQLYELRKSLTTGLLKHIPDIINRRRKLDQDLAKVKTTPPVSSRFVSAVSTVLTVYEMCGSDDDPHDAEELYKAVVAANKSRLETVYAADAKSQVLDSILFTKCVQMCAGVGSIAEKVSPRDLIINGTSDDINVLNNSHCGVYCIPDRKWMIFYWRQIRTAVFSTGYNPYRNYNEGGLRESIAKNKYLVANIDTDTHKYIVRTLNLADAKTPASYSVVSMAYLREDYEELPAAPVRKTVSVCPPEPPVSCYESDPELQEPWGAYEDTDTDFDI